MIRRLTLLATCILLALYGALVANSAGCFEDETRISGQCIPIDNLGCESDSDCEAKYPAGMITGLPMILGGWIR